MNEVFQYKGYYASIHFNPVEKIYFGKMLGIDEVVIFEAESLPGLKEAFLSAVETHMLCLPFLSSPQDEHGQE